MTHIAPTLDPGVLDLLRETIRVGLARGATVREVAAEARGLGRGLTIGQGMPDLAPVVDDLLREVDPLLPDLAPVELDARPQLLGQFSLNL